MSAVKVFRQGISATKNFKRKKIHYHHMMLNSGLSRDDLVTVSFLRTSRAIL